MLCDPDLAIARAKASQDVRTLAISLSGSLGQVGYLPDPWQPPAGWLFCQIGIHGSLRPATGCTIIENIHARKYIRYNRLKNIYAKKYQRLDTWVDPWVVPWEIIIKNENACFRTHSRDLGAIPPRK